MSLKAFHILFITLSTLLAFGFGVWSLRSHATEPDTTLLTLGVLSLLVGVGLLIYGVRFYRKLKTLDSK